MIGSDQSSVMLQWMQAHQTPSKGICDHHAFCCETKSTKLLLFFANFLFFFMEIEIKFANLLWFFVGKKIFNIFSISFVNQKQLDTIRRK